MLNKSAKADSLSLTGTLAVAICLLVVTVALLRNRTTGSLLYDDRAASELAVFELVGGDNVELKCCALHGHAAQSSCAPSSCDEHEGYVMRYQNATPPRWMVSVRARREYPTRCALRASDELEVHPLNVQSDLDRIRGSCTMFDVTMEDETASIQWRP